MDLEGSHPLWVHHHSRRIDNACQAGLRGPWPTHLACFISHCQAELAGSDEPSLGWFSPKGSQLPAQKPSAQSPLVPETPASLLKVQAPCLELASLSSIACVFVRVHFLPGSWAMLEITHVPRRANCVNYNNCGN